MEPAAFREHLLREHAGTRLEIVRPDTEAKIRTSYPWLPEEYFNFLKQVGWGAIGDSRYMVYEGPLEPSDIFDEQTAADLKGVVLVGDDFGEYCDGYAKRGTKCIFGSVSKEDGEFTAHSEAGLVELLLSWLGKR